MEYSIYKKNQYIMIFLFKENEILDLFIIYKCALGPHTSTILCYYTNLN